MKHIVIIGGGVDGYQAARGVVQTNPDALVIMIGAESRPAYDRPHLSKAYLSNGHPLYLSGDDIHSNDKVTFHRRTLAKGIDRNSRQVLLEVGQTIGYERLILATGSRIRILPAEVAPEQPLYLRTIDDAELLRSRLVPGCTLAVIGGDFIGLEVAASARRLGCKVIVLE